MNRPKIRTPEGHRGSATTKEKRGRDQKRVTNSPEEIKPIPHEKLRYTEFIFEHPELISILHANSDPVEAENQIFLRVDEITGGDEPLAYAVSGLIGRRHPTVQPEREQMAERLSEYRRLYNADQRERRRLNCLSGGKVVSLDAHRKRVDPDWREHIARGHRLPPEERKRAWAALELRIGVAERQYRNEYAKLARKHMSADWKPPEHLAPEGSRPLVDFVVPFDELVNLDVPAREHIVTPWLPCQSINMLFAPRGLGKTWFGLELAQAVALGRRFLAWSTPKARRVLFIDGEMPLKSLVERFKALSGGKTISNLDILPSEALWLDDKPLNLNSEADQGRITVFLEHLDTVGRKPELIVIDNLSSLTADSDENSNSELDSLLRFLVGLRHKGFAVLLVHHSGKSGDQRGASRREDLLDTSIKLNATKDGEPQRGARFEIEFVKTRGERPDPDKLEAELVAGEHGNLEWIFGQKSNLGPLALLLIAIRDTEPKSQAPLQEELGVSQGAVSQQIRKGRDQGFISHDKRPTLTAKGRSYIDKISPPENELF